MKRLIIRHLFLCCFLVLPFISKGTHVRYAEMYYQWVSSSNSDSTYEITLMLYLNCDGTTVSPPSSYSIDIKSSSRNYSSTLSLTKLPHTGTGIPDVNLNYRDCSSNGTGPCIHEYVYRALWTSPGKANDWIFSTRLTSNWLNATFTNVTSSTSVYVDCGLNNLDFPDSLNRNSSPIFHNQRPNRPGFLTDTLFNPPFYLICECRDIVLDQTVREYDGDSLDYRLVYPRSWHGSNKSGINGFDVPTYPFPLKNGPARKLDSITGEMRFVSGQTVGTGKFENCVRVTEYRNDTVITGGIPVVTKKMIGFNTRNFYVEVVDSASCVDSDYFIIDSLGQEITDSLYLSCGEDKVTIGLNSDIQCSTLDTNGSEFLLVNGQDTIGTTRVNGRECGSSWKTSLLDVTFDSILLPGEYKMFFRKGPDTNTFVTECGLMPDQFADSLKIVIGNSPGLGYVQGQLSSPKNDTIHLNCGKKDFVIRFSELARCNSVALDGSDFEFRKIMPGIPVNKVVKSVEVFCDYNGGFTNRVKLNLDQQLYFGTYRLSVKRGSDGNRFVGQCADEWASSTLIIVVDGFGIDLGNDFAYCKRDGLDTTLRAPLFFSEYTWNDGSKSNRLTVDSAGKYWVEVENIHGCIQSDTINIEERICTGIEEYSTETYSVFPNPGTGIFNVELSKDNTIQKIDVYNVLGEKILESSTTTNVHRDTIDLSDFPEGVYIFRIIPGSGEDILIRVIKKN